MKVFMTILAKGTIVVQARPEGDNVIGDMTDFVEPGEDFLGHSYDELVAMGNGEHDLTAK